MTQTLLLNHADDDTKEVKLDHEEDSKVDSDGDQIRIVMNLFVFALELLGHLSLPVILLKMMLMIDHMWQSDNQ